MDERILDLLLFFKEKGEYSIEDRIAWINFYDLQEFVDIFGGTLSDDGGYDVKLQYDCVVINFGELLDSYFYENEVNYIIEKLREWSD